jgi:hypothetical protein
MLGYILGIFSQNHLVTLLPVRAAASFAPMGKLSPLTFVTAAFFMDMQMLRYNNWLGITRTVAFG